MIDLRLGRWQDVLADVECDAVICDPPYGERNHKGAHSRSSDRAKILYDSIEYAHLSPEDVDAFVRSWAPRTKGWIVAMTSHDLFPAWEQSFSSVGRYHFAPVPIRFDMGPRFAADGPSSSAVYLMVARPKEQRFLGWGSLPGWYHGVREDMTNRCNGTSDAGHGRNKPGALMRAIVRDYSRPGDLVCDPFAGYGTTARACASLGRRFVGAECDADAYAEAQRRLADVVTVDVQGVQRVRQEALL